MSSRPNARQRADSVGGWRPSTFRGGVLAVAIVFWCVGIGYWRIFESSHEATSQINAEAEETVSRLIESEDWILKRTTDLPKLARSVFNMQLPDITGARLFDQSVTVIGLDRREKSPERLYALDDLKISADRWHVAKEPQISSPDQLQLWKPLFDELAFFEQARFHIVRANFLDSAREQVRSDVSFAGLARTRASELVEIKAEQRIIWKKNVDTDPPSWRIVRWQQDSFTTKRRQAKLFRDVTVQAIPDKQQRRLARQSKHERMLIDLLEGRTARPHKYFSPHASDRHPALSIVDIDRDGFDDLYVMPRWGRNLLLRNRGDGTFEDIAASVGLDIENHCSSAIFADFDNDGDADLFLGRTLQRSMYLVNEEGRFVDCSESHVATLLPNLVFSISAADYNRDGLIDVFFATYAQQTQSMSPPNSATQRWLEDFLTDKQAGQLYQFKNRHRVVDQPGPPNVMLVNRGGAKFELALENDQLTQWRQTTQGTWADYDEDGDPDLYVSNDFSKNTFFRNDWPNGFVDVTDETGTADIGFGMGVSWGDYDLDGRQDLYISNMFSKAGRRITAQIDSLDPRVAQASRGNSMFRNTGARFAKVSGLDAPALQVEKAGWSWGGQFVDLDNNGYLDIHVLSGFYTAPREFALPTDL